MAIDLNTSPYYDDFDEAKKFYRILYRPAVSVQARELTQMQTILQNQVSKFGDHVFKDGSMVIPGEVNVNPGVSFMKLENIQDGTDVKSYLKQFVDTIITGGTTGIQARVLDTSECDCVDDSTIATLYFVYEGSGTDDTTNKFAAGEVITAKKVDNTTSANEKLTTPLASDISVTIRTNADDGGLATSYTNTPLTDVVGNGLLVEVKEGIYYIDGRFVKNEELHYYAGRFQDNPSVNVGFTVTETVVKPEEDSSLNDNARGTPNYAAPGAHRLKVDMTLGKNPADVTKKFVKLVSLKRGQVNSVVKQTDYAELEKTLARRTYDESGDYEVNKFKLASREHKDDGTNDGIYPTLVGAAVDGLKYGDATKFAVSVDPGKAYVRGFEVENTSVRYIDVPRAREDSTGAENGHVVRLAEQPVGTPTGNYVIVNDATHLPNFEAFEEVHLCDVKISSDGTSPAVANQVGSARVRMYQVHSGSHSGGTATEFKLGLFDIQMDSGKTFEKDVRSVATTAGGSSEFTSDIVQTVDTSITVGLVTTTSDPTVTGKGTNFVDAFRAGDAMYVDGTFVGIVSSVTNSTALELTANAASNITDGRPGVGRSEIFEAEYVSLLYPVGYNMVKTLRGVDGSGNDTVETADFTTRRIITENAGSSGWTHTLTATNETFVSDQIVANYTLIDNSTNVHVDITASDITFDNDANRKIITIDNDMSTLTNGRSYSLICSVRQTGTDAGEKTKTLVNDTTQTVTTKKNVTARSITLTHADIYKLESVKMTPGDFATYNDSNAVDITDRYTLDNGQRSTHYQAGKIILKPGAQTPTGAIRITYDYYSYSGDGNYFSVNSYSQDLEDILSFKTTVDGQTTTIPLHDCIDFRPVISGSNAFDHEIPALGSDFSTDLAYYVGRIDKIALDSTGTFNVVAGTPAVEPQQPKDPNDQMVLATLFVPPYTKVAKDVKIDQRSNRRYTMKDIGSLDRRVRALEYYVVLNLLEQDTSRIAIKDTNTGLDRFKNGFIVDAFTGHGIGDPKQTDYRVSVDRVEQTLRPMHFTEAVNIVESLSTGASRSSQSNTYTKTGDLITLPYNQSTYIENSQATRSIDVNPYKLAAFKGEIQIIPDADLWKDVDRRPDLVKIDDNNFDAIKFIAEQAGITGTEWNEWETNWTGRTTQNLGGFNTTSTSLGNNRTRFDMYQDVYTDEIGYQSRTGTQVTLTSQDNPPEDYGDRVVDISYAEFMRAKPITYIAANLKPDTTFFGFFDDVAVDSYVRPADVFTVELPSGYSSFNFYPDELTQKVLADDPRRASEGVYEPAFQFGDIVVNQAHTPTYATAVSHITDGAGAASFDMTVNTVTGISPGHLVYLSNFGKRTARDAEELGSRNSMQSTSSKSQKLRTSASNSSEITLSAGEYIPRNNTHQFRRPATSAHTITGSGNTSKQLEGRVFKVSAVDTDTNVITLVDPEGATIAAFDAYSTANYGVGDGGTVQRLTASAIVAHAGYINITSPAGVITDQDIHLVNMVNGFAVGDRLLGKTEISSSTFNVVDVKAINGDTSETAAPTLKVPGDGIKTDLEGTAVGVFNLPNNERLAFRVGERAFKLSDNISNTDENFDSLGRAVFTAQGYTLSKERTLVSSRTASFATDRLFSGNRQRTRRVGSTQRLVSTWTRNHDPLAQTFTVRSPGGAFVTDVDLYFSSTGRRPVTVEIRTTNSTGVPSTKVLPFSQITKQTFDVATSSDASIATNFKFKAPIYLQNGETYAVIVKTDEPGCQVYVSELGGTDLTNNSPVNQNPLKGSLFLSQNGEEFVSHPLKDLKFTLRQAKFTINETKTVDFKGTPPAPITLKADPIQMAPNTNKVRILVPNHGFQTGQKALISGVVEGIYGSGSTSNGFQASAINGTHTVLATGLEPDSFIIELPTDDGALVGSVNSLVKGFYGGTGVSCSRQLTVDGFFLNSQDVVLGDTTLKYFFDVENNDGSFSGLTGITPGQTRYLTSRKFLKSFENQATAAAGPPVLKTSSLQVRAELFSNNDNISPVIDMQQMVGYGIQNRVSSFTDTQFNVIELDSTPMTNSSSISNTTVQSTGSGTITYSSSNNFVSGTSSNFQGDVFPGDILRRASDQAIIGTVLTVNSATQVMMTRNAEVTDGSPVNYIVQSNGNITFSNANTTSGQIVTNVDAVDDTLQNVKVGQHIDIKSVMSGINGSYLVSDVTLTSANNTFGGNANQDKTTITLATPFTKTNQAGSSVAVRLHAVNATSSFIGTGTASVSYGGTGVSGSSSKFQSEVNVGDFLETATGNVVGKVATITDDTTITLSAASQEAMSSSAYRVQSNSANFSVDLLDRYVDDIAVDGASNLANYITRPLNLTTAAQSIKIIMDVNIPAGCSIVAMYKTASDLERLDSVNLYTDSGYVSSAIDSDEQFREVEINIDDLNEFKVAVIKLVMKSSNPVNVPKVKNFRMICHS